MSGFPFRPMSRRDMLKTASTGFGYLALAGLASQASAAPSLGNPLAPKSPHFEGKAKRVIFMYMRGGPSHVDTFDYKPQLAVDNGKDYNGGYANNPSRSAGRKLLQSPWKFPQHGESGLPISELFPHLSKHADDLCLINSMQTDLPNHPQACVQLHTGSFAFVRPSMGSWITYGLGTENNNLPGFITLNPPDRLGGAQNYGSAFLPAPYEGTRIGNEGQNIAQATVANLNNARISTSAQREQLELLQSLNRDRLERDEVNTQLEGVIESYELAFRMQGALPELMDLSSETRETQQKYGIGNGPTDDFGRQCLMARRFAESGVRFIELCHTNWDQHGGLRARLTANCTAIDQPISALLSDLEQRGLLKDTLVVWSGEFGRTPHARGDDGRDHQSTGYSAWMAGGGIKGGLRYGATDEHGIEAVENKVHIHDLHATILHLLGLDHKQLTYRYSGRDFRLTDVYGRVVSDIIA